jgi:hypothetical protein
MRLVEVFARRAAALELLGRVPEAPLDAVGRRVEASTGATRALDEPVAGGERLLGLERGRLVADSIEPLRRRVEREPRQDQPPAQGHDYRETEEQNDHAETGRLGALTRNSDADDPGGDDDAREEGDEWKREPGRGRLRPRAPTRCRC